MAIATLVVDLVLKTGKLGAQIGTALAPVGKKITSFGLKTSAAISAPIAGIAIAITKAAIDFESGVAGMVKTVDGMADSTGKLTAEGEALVGQLREMSKEVPVTFETLSRIGELAGQLGVPMDDIVSFTEVIAKLGATTDLTYEAAATQIAKFANITGMADTDIERYASTVVHLGNNLATTETELVAMTLRLAGLGPTLDISEKDLLAWGGAMSSVGIRAEMGGSALTKAFVTMNEAVSMGGKELDMFAETADMSVDDFVKLFKTDASAAMKAFILGLDKFKKKGGDAFILLDDLGLSQIRVRDTLLRLSGASGTLTEAFALSNQGWEENVALTREAELRFKTSASQIQMLKSTMRDLAVEAGLVLVPILMELVETVKPIITSVMDWIRENPELTKTIMAIAGAVALIGPALVILGVIISGIGTVATVVGAILSPIGLVLAGIGLAIAGLALAWKENVGGIQEKTQELWARIEPIWNDIKELFLAVKDTIVETIGPEIMEAFDSIRQTLAEMGIDWESIWGVIKGAVIVAAAIIGTILLGLAMIIVGVTGGIARALSRAAEGFRKWKEGVEKVIAGIVESFEGWKDVIGGILTLDFERIIEGAKKIFSGWMTSWSGLLETFEGGFKATFGAVFGFVEGFIDGVIKLFDNLYDRLIGGSLIPDIVNGIIKWFTKLPNELLEKMGTFLDDLYGKFIGFKDRLLGLLGELVEKASTLFGDLVGGAIGWFDELYNRLVGGSIVPNMVKDINASLGGLSPTLGSLTGMTPATVPAGGMGGMQAVSVSITNYWDASISAKDRMELRAEMFDTTYAAFDKIYGG